MSERVIVVNKYKLSDGKQTITIELNRVPPEETPEQAFEKRMLDEEFSTFFERWSI